MKVVLAIDGSQYSDAAIRTVMKEMRPRNAELRVLHVVEPLLLIPQFREGDIEALKAAEQQLWKQGNRLVAAAARTLRAAGFSVTTAVVEGDPRGEIIDCSAHAKADLILLGSHGRKGLARFLLGSVAEYVARHARCSVEIVRTQKGKALRKQRITAR